MGLDYSVLVASVLDANLPCSPGGGREGLVTTEGLSSGHTRLPRRIRAQHRRLRLRTHLVGKEK